jgi:hypothetical protein
MLFRINALIYSAQFSGRSVLVERGDLAIDNRAATVFVFDGLIANCFRPQAVKWALRRRHWENAMDLWAFDHRVCNYMDALMRKYNVPVEVITWQPHGFARVLSDRLWEMQLPVRDVIAGTYKNMSQTIAIDTGVSTVYDPDPHHRYAYGYKVREVSWNG